MDRSLATFLRSLQTSATHEDASHLLPSATGLLANLNNPHNLETLSTQLLSAPALWNAANGLSFTRQLFGSFYTAATSVTQTGEPQVSYHGPVPLRKLKVEDWTKAVVQGANEKSPRWRHILLLGGILLSLARDQGQSASHALRRRLESALVTATNLALETTPLSDKLGQLSIALVLNHTFDVLSNVERTRLDYDRLLPVLTEAIFTSREGLEHGTFLSLVDQDVQEVPGRKFQWSPQSSTCNHLRSLLAKPLTSALGPLSRLAAHALDNVRDEDLAVDAVGRVMDFTRVLSIQWRQNKLSEIDASEEATYLDPATIQVSLPVLWQALRSSLYAVIIILRAALGRVLNDPLLAIENRAVQVATQSLHSMRNTYFISTRLGQTATVQYNFVTFTAVDILNTHPIPAQAFLRAIRPTSVGTIPEHPLDRCLDLFFLNTAEHFTLSLPSQICDEMLLTAASPYLVVGGNNILLEIFEAAHSLTLAVFAVPHNAQLTVRHLPFYIDTLFKAFPLNLSERQFRFAFRTLVGVVSPPSALAGEHPLLASTLLQLVLDRAWDAPHSPLPELPPAAGQSPRSPSSEQTVLIMALLDALPHLSPETLEEWLPLAASLTNRVTEPKSLKACRQRFWEVLSSGEMDIQRATIAVAWWTSRGGRELVLYGDSPDQEDRYVMSGALDAASKL